MESRHDGNAASVDAKLASHSSDSISDAKEPSHGRAPKCDDDLRIHQFKLPGQIRDAGVRLDWRGTTIVGRPAFDDIADVDFIPTEPHGFNHLIEELARGADEGLTLRVFFGTWSLSYKTQTAGSGAAGKHCLLAFRVKITAHAPSNLGAQFL